MEVIPVVRSSVAAPKHARGEFAPLKMAALLAGAGAAALLVRGGTNWRSLAVLRGKAEKRAVETPLPHAAGPTVKAARRLNRAAGTLAFSVLADSAMEHYRGSFHNPFMYVPLVVSSLTLLMSGHGVSHQRPRAHRLRDLVYSAAALTGFAGTGFHIYNIVSRPGGFSWLNLFYGAPILAPNAIFLSGLLGFMAERIRAVKAGLPVKFLGLPAGRLTAAITSLGLVGTALEAALLHFRGAFHDPFMFIPVTIPPAPAAVMGEAAVGPHSRDRGFSRWWMRLTAAVGLAGAGFHVYGVHRNMGGMAQLASKRLQWAPYPRSTQFYRPSACWTRGSGSERGAAKCLTAILDTTSSPSEIRHLGMNRRAV